MAKIKKIVMFLTIGFMVTGLMSMNVAFSEDNIFDHEQDPENAVIEENHDPETPGLILDIIGDEADIDLGPVIEDEPVESGPD
ncbi:MAG: hypothetical protein MI799_18100 [Desulfobacterales bacterium]|nr:hypothetical protein [Desulfobacterales bacterium]